MTEQLKAGDRVKVDTFEALVDYSDGAGAHVVIEGVGLAYVPAGLVTKVEPAGPAAATLTLSPAAAQALRNMLAHAVPDMTGLWSELCDQVEAAGARWDCNLDTIEGRLSFTA